MHTPFRKRVFLATAIFSWLGFYSVLADERTDLVLDLERRLQQSEGNKQAVSQVATIVVNKGLDVRTLIVCYASRNLTRVAVEMRRPPITTDFEGKAIKFDETAAIDFGASQIVAILIAGQTPQSRFRQEFAKLIGPKPDTEKVSEVLGQAVQNYSVPSLKARLEANKDKWPFPFCLPNCE